MYDHPHIIMKRPRTLTQENPLINECADYEDENRHYHQDDNESIGTIESLL